MGTITQRQSTESGHCQPDRRSAFRTAYYSHAWLTAKSFLDNAKENLQTLKTPGQGQRLGDKSPNLKALKPAVEKVEKRTAAEYEKITNETVAINQQIAERWADLSENGGLRFMENATTLLNGQKNKMSGEIQANKDAAMLQERLDKINLIGDIISTGNLTRAAGQVARAERQPKYIEDANANFEIIKEKSLTLLKIIRSEEDTKNLNKVEQAADGYKKAMNEFLALCYAE